MPHDERRFRSLRGRARKAFFGQRLASVESGTRDLERAEARKHGKYLGRIAELATELERAHIGAPACRRREAAILGVDASECALYAQLEPQPLFRSRHARQQARCGLKLRDRFDEARV